jgi:hypothetical protein
MGMVTPGRVGEFQRAIHLSHDSGKGLATTSGLLLLDLGLEVFTYASFGLAGVLLLMLGGTVMGISVYVFCILTSFLCLLMVRLPIAFALRWVPFVGRVPGFPHLLPALVVGLRGNTALRVAAISFGMALAYSQMIMTLTAPMNLNLSFVEYLTMVGIVGISGAIPISYFGFGTREIALIWYFGFLGLDTPTAIAVSFTFVLAQLLGTVLSVCLGFGLGRLVPGAARISP